MPAGPRCGGRPRHRRRRRRRAAAPVRRCAALSISPRWIAALTSSTVARPKWSATAPVSAVAGPRVSSPRAACHSVTAARWWPPPQSPEIGPSAGNRATRPSRSRPRQLMPAPQMTAIAFGIVGTGAQQREQVVLDDLLGGPAGLAHGLAEGFDLDRQVDAGQVGDEQVGRHARLLDRLRDQAHRARRASRRRRGCRATSRGRERTRARCRPRRRPPRRSWSCRRRSRRNAHRAIAHRAHARCCARRPRSACRSAGRRGRAGRSAGARAGPGRPGRGHRGARRRGRVPRRR